MQEYKYPALRDVKGAFDHWPIIVYMALSDLKARYKRSVLGPFWLTLTTAIGSAGLGFLWSELMKVEARNFVPMLTVGLILWQFISSTIIESPLAFSRQSSIVRNISLPLSIFPAQVISRQIINLIHNIPVFFIVWLVLRFDLSVHGLLAIPALLIVILNLSWLSLLLSLLGARFRDLEYFISAVMPILMFVSPVFYRPNFLPFSEWVIWLNPLSHLIEIVRGPLLGGGVPMFVIITNFVMLLVGWVFTLWIFNRKHASVAFWI